MSIYLSVPLTSRKEHQVILSPRWNLKTYLIIFTVPGLRSGAFDDFALCPTAAAEQITCSRGTPSSAR